MNPSADESSDESNQRSSLRFCPRSFELHLTPELKVHSIRESIDATRDILVERMNRREFQSLAVERLDDARALLNAGRYSGAYYISGYAIECALKACIARKTKQDDFPPKEAAKYYVHDFPKLLDIADLGAALKQEAGQDPAFGDNWTVVKDWTEETRYQSRGQRHAEQILAAINDPQHGVLQWLRKNW